MDAEFGITYSIADLIEEGKDFKRYNIEIVSKDKGINMKMDQKGIIHVYDKSLNGFFDFVEAEDTLTIKAYEELSDWDKFPPDDNNTFKLNKDRTISLLKKPERGVLGLSTDKK